MLLGKRPRPPMKRTTSMKDVAVDLSSATAASKPSDPEIQAIGDGNQLPWGDGSYNIDRRPNLTAASALGVMVPPPGPRRNSVSYASAVEAAPFLRACALCNKHLHSGRDIFMYRGEIGFCSSECREQQMKLDEWKEKAKCSTSSAKDSSQAKAKRSTTASGGGSGNGETVAAA